jgi:hypothetical protein
VSRHSFQITTPPVLPSTWLLGEVCPHHALVLAVPGSHDGVGCLVRRHTERLGEECSCSKNCWLP